MNFRVVTIALFLLAVCMSTAMAMTLTGTSIKATGTAKYYSTSGALMPTATSNTVTTVVGQVGAVAISPVSTSKTSTSGSAVYFPITITNSGNGSDTFTLSTSSTAGSTLKVYQDTNGDGVYQSTETTTVTSTPAISAGGTFKGFVSVLTASGITADTVTLTATSKFDSTKLAKATLRLTASASNVGYIKSWLFNGYYTNTDNSTRLSTDYLSGEASVTPTAGSTSGGNAWAVWDSATDSIDLGAAFGNPISCAGYACVYVNSPTAQQANLWMGSDNGIKVWLNGQNIWTNDSTRGYTVDQDKVGINLVSGWNALMIKVSQYGGNWCFSAKICDSTGTATSGLTFALNPPATSTEGLAISNVTLADLGCTTAKVTWDTNLPSTTLVQYGVSTRYGGTWAGTQLVTGHVATLSGMKPNTKYYLRVGSADAAGNLVWNDNGYNFTTASLPVPTSAYIDNWLMNGFYSNSTKTSILTTDYLNGEAKVAPRDGTKMSNGSTWYLLENTGHLIDMAGQFGAPTMCAGYAFAYVYSPTAQAVNILMGSDDGIKVWLNGQVVWTDNAFRTCVDGQDSTAVNLTAGWNRLLVKVSQSTSGWQFILKICDSSGKQIPGLSYTTAPI